MVKKELNISLEQLVVVKIGPPKIRTLGFPDIKKVLSVLVMTTLKIDNSKLDYKIHTCIYRSNILDHLKFLEDTLVYLFAYKTLSIPKNNNSFLYT